MIVLVCTYKRALRLMSFLALLLSLALSSSYSTAEAARASAPGSCPNDCSLGGECVLGACRCDAPFTGPDCGTLRLAPARTGRALFSPNASSWGGAPLALPLGSKTPRYYMYVATMANGCGLNSWTCNSQCSVAVADSIEGPYEIVGEPVVPAFCHNPSVHVSPEGNIVLFHIGSGQPHDGVAPIICHAGNGSTDVPKSLMCKRTSTSAHVAASDAFVAGQFQEGEQVAALPNVASAPVDMPLGPFTELRSQEGWGANNPAVHIFANGTVIMIAKFECNTTVSPDPAQFCRQFGVFVAPRWDAANYTFVKMLDVFGEDPCLFETKRGLHMVADLRQYTPAAGPVLNRTSAIHHAYSVNGLDWTIDASSVAASTVVPLRNARTLRVTRRERPHVLRSATSPHVPLALFSAGALGNTHDAGGDQTFTMVQPFGQ